MFRDFYSLFFLVAATLCVHGYRVQSVGSLGGNRRHAFELIPPDTQAQKYFYFVAETETEKKRYVYPCTPPPPPPRLSSVSQHAAITILLSLIHI